MTAIAYGTVFTLTPALVRARWSTADFGRNWGLLTWVRVPPCSRFPKPVPDPSSTRSQVVLCLGRAPLYAPVWRLARPRDGRHRGELVVHEHALLPPNTSPVGGERRAGCHAGRSAGVKVGEAGLRFASIIVLLLCCSFVRD